MALVIELVSAGKVIDGYETGWNKVDLAIERSSLSFPVLERVDPYGIVRIDGEDLGRMAEELGALPAPAPRKLVDRLTDLCLRAQREGDDAYLLFSGD